MHPDADPPIPWADLLSQANALSKRLSDLELSYLQAGFSFHYMPLTDRNANTDSLEKLRRVFKITPGNPSPEIHASITNNRAFRDDCRRRAHNERPQGVWKRR